MSHTYHSGRLSTAFAGTATANTRLNLIAWSVNPSAEKVVFRTSETSRFSEKEVTFMDCQFSVTVEHNFLASDYGTSGANLSLLGGGTVAVQLFLNGTSNASWNFPQAILMGNPQNVAIEGKIGTVFNFESSGPWTEPNTSP